MAQDVEYVAHCVDDFSISLNSELMWYKQMATYYNYHKIIL